MWGQHAAGMTTPGRIPSIIVLVICAFFTVLFIWERNARPVTSSAAKITSVDVSGLSTTLVKVTQAPVHVNTTSIVNNTTTTTATKIFVTTLPSHPAVSCTQAHRLETLQEACHKQGESAHRPAQYVSQIIVDDKHKLIYCHMPKCASTTLLQILIMASGKRFKSLDGITIQGSKFLSSYGLRPLSSFNETEQTNRLKSYFKFLVVRHPYDRIVSAWRDKLLIDKYLKHLSLSIGKRSHHSPLRAHYYKPDIPSVTIDWENNAYFPEFVHYLALTNYTDIHWKSFEIQCQPCSIEWDAVMKVETMENDSQTVMQRLGNDVKVSALPVKHTHQVEDVMTLKTKELLEFSGMQPQEKQFLHKYYERDMDMFGYGWDSESLQAKCSDKNSCC